VGCAKIKKEEENDDWSRFFLVKGCGIKGCITKVVEQIVMDFGLLILHKIKVLIL